MQRKKEKEKAMTGDISKYYLFVKQEFGTVNGMVDGIDASTYGNNDGFLIKNEAYNYFEDNLDTFESSDFNAFWKTVDVERGGNVLGGNVIDLNAMNDNEIEMMEQKFLWFELLQEYMDDWQYPSELESYRDYIPEYKLRSSIKEALTDSICAMFNYVVDDPVQLNDDMIRAQIELMGNLCTRTCSAELFKDEFTFKMFNNYFNELTNQLDYRIMEDNEFLDIVNSYIITINGDSDLSEVILDLKKIILNYLDTADNDGEIPAQNMNGLNNYCYNGQKLNGLQKAVLYNKYNKDIKDYFRNNLKKDNPLHEQYKWAIDLYLDKFQNETLENISFSAFAEYASKDPVNEFKASNAYKGLEVYKRYLNPVDNPSSPYYNYWDALKTAVDDLLNGTGYSLDRLINDGTWAEVISTVAELYANGFGTPRVEMPGSGSGTEPGTDVRGNQIKGVCPTPAPAVPAPGVSPVIPTIDVLEGKAIIIDIINTLKEKLGLGSTQGGGGVDPEDPTDPEDPNTPGTGEEPGIYGSDTPLDGVDYTNYLDFYLNTRYHGTEDDGFTFDEPNVLHLWGKKENYGWMDAAVALYENTENPIFNFGYNEMRVLSYPPEYGSDDIVISNNTLIVKTKEVQEDKIICVRLSMPDEITYIDENGNVLGTSNYIFNLYIKVLNKSESSSSPDANSSFEINNSLITNDENEVGKLYQVKEIPLSDEELRQEYINILYEMICKMYYQETIAHPNCSILYSWINSSIGSYNELCELSLEELQAGYENLIEKLKNTSNYPGLYALVKDMKPQTMKETSNHYSLTLDPNGQFDMNMNATVSGYNSSEITYELRKSDVTDGVKIFANIGNNNNLTITAGTYEGECKLTIYPTVDGERIGSPLVIEIKVNPRNSDDLPITPWGSTFGP